MRTRRRHPQMARTKNDKSERRSHVGPLATRLSYQFIYICTFCVLPSPHDLLVHHYVCVGNGSCTLHATYDNVSSHSPTTYHAHALCITFLPPKSVAKSKEKHKARAGLFHAWYLGSCLTMTSGGAVCALTKGYKDCCTCATHLIENRVWLFSVSCVLGRSLLLNWWNQV